MSDDKVEYMDAMMRVMVDAGSNYIEGHPLPSDAEVGDMYFNVAALLLANTVETNLTFTCDEHKEEYFRWAMQAIMGSLVDAADTAGLVMQVNELVTEEAIH